MEIKEKPLKAGTLRGRKKAGAMSPTRENDLTTSLVPEQENRQTDLDDFTLSKRTLKKRRPKAKKEEVSADELAAVKAQLGQAVEAHLEEVKPKPQKPRVKRPSATKRRVIEAAVEACDDEPKKPSAYVHPCFWKLPHRDPGKNADGTRVSYWNSGDDLLKLTVQADQGTGYGIPYGAVTRLILAMAMRSAVIYKERELNLGRCQRVFLEELGMHNGGRQIRSLKEQMRRLFFSLLTIETPQAKTDTITYGRLLIFEQGTGEVDYWKGEDGAKWPESLIMSESFYSAAREKPIPIRLETIQALAKSPLAVDLYLWLSYRMFRLRKSRKTFVKITWEGLQKEFGVGYPETPRGKRDFKTKVLKTLKTIEVVYTQIQGHVHPERGYLKLTPAPIAHNLRSC